MPGALETVIPRSCYGIRLRVSDRGRTRRWWSAVTVGGRPRKNGVRDAGSGVDFDFIALCVVEVGQFVEVVAVAADVADRRRDADEQDQPDEEPQSGATARLVRLGVIELVAFVGVELGVVVVVRFVVGFEFRVAALGEKRGAVGRAELEAVVQVDLEEGEVGHTPQYAHKMDMPCGDGPPRAAAGRDGPPRRRLPVGCAGVAVFLVRRSRTSRMDDDRRAFLEDLLTTPSPSGYEVAGQRVWVDYVSQFADDVTVDDYGNAVAVHEGTGGGPEIAFTGHADQIGYIVRDIDDDGFVRIGPIGGADRTVSKGQHVTVHGDDGDVAGVIGQTAIHLRDVGSEEYDDLEEQFVDIGATSKGDAKDHVEVGDPVTVEARVRDLAGDRVAANGMDNRVGTWSAAEGLRAAVEADVDATVYAVSTVQEEVGVQGAKMVGYDLDPDAMVAVDVTHATDNPDVPGKRKGPVELGEGPVVSRGSANHPNVVSLARDAAADADIDVQLQAAGVRTGTDADAFYTSRSGIPSLNIGIPNRYMHTPVEVVSTSDLDDVAALLGSIAALAGDVDSFGVDL